MDSNIKNELLGHLHESVVRRKAMFIPILCISAFGLVGYAAVDKDAPVIDSSKVEVLYGTKLDPSIFAISDNRDSLEALDIQINDRSYDPFQLGVYNVDVTATDMFSNTTTKTVQVKVVDRTAPEFEVVGKNNGYVVNVEANGSNNIADYIQAVDNVDGDVTPFIESNHKLDSSKLGSQTITLSVSDNVGNKSEKTYEFYVSDSTAPTLSYKHGKDVTIDYGSKFNYENHIKVYDAFDKQSATVKVEGEVDTKKLGTTQVTVIATDSSGNESKGNLNVTVKDISAPKISLSKSSVTIVKGKSFNAKSYLKSATDNKDGNVTSKVKIKNSVNTQKAGKYTVTYSVTDAAGNTAKTNLKVTIENPVTANQGVAKTALGRVGCHYKYGATGPNYFDCSGFTQWSYRQNGISIPRTAQAQYSSTKRVSKSSLKPGDLVFFQGTVNKKGITHAGIYVGGGRFVHAGSTRTGVYVSSLNSAYWRSHFVSGGRK